MSTPLAELIPGLSEFQLANARVIESEFTAAGIGRELTAAALVNAYAESRLRADAVGDKGRSVGLFQLHEKGLGAGMSVADRKDPVVNTRRIIKTVLGAQGRPLLALYEGGERRVPQLAAKFSTYIERPKHTTAEEAARAAMALRLFPLGISAGGEVVAVAERVAAPVRTTASHLALRGAAVAAVALLVVGLVRHRARSSSTAVRRSNPSVRRRRRSSFPR